MSVTEGSVEARYVVLGTRRVGKSAFSFLLIQALKLEPNYCMWFGWAFWLLRFDEEQVCVSPCVLYPVPAIWIAILLKC